MNASIAYSVAGVAYTQNFDSLGTSAAAWTDDSTIDGWYNFSGGLASPIASYAAGTGSSATGNLYSFGVAGTNALTDRALGSISTGTLAPIHYGVAFQNTTGWTLTRFQVSYRGEQWRDASGTQAIAHRLDFAYRISAALDTITTAGFVDHDPLDFSSLVNGTAGAGALDGNAVGNFTALGPTTIDGITWLPNQFLWLRWKDEDDTGADHGLSIDDVSFTATVPEPTLLSLIAAGVFGAGTAIRRRLARRRVA